MRHQLAIRRAQVVKPHGIFPCTVLVDDERISGFAAYDDQVDASQEINADGCFVLPGVIDPHVHLGGYSQTLTEDYRTESQAAATGGVTTIFHYLFHDGSYKDVFQDTVALAESNSCIDVDFHLGIILESQILELHEYAEELGVKSFKMLMSYKGQEARATIRGLDDGQIFRAFKKIAQIERGLAIVHAENPEIIKAFQTELMETGRQDTSAWSESRPAFGELEAIRRMILFAREAGVTLVIPHLSVGIGSQFISDCATATSSVFVETCGHYLLLTQDVDRGILGKLNPPLRSQEQVNALWERMSDGTIDFLGSDHVPHTRSSKGADLWTAKPGLTGVSMTLPILLSEGVHKRGMPLEKVVRLTSYNPANIFNLYPRKGCLEVGSDADMVLLDLDREVIVTPEALNSVSDYTPYQGYVCHGWPRMTLSRGHIIYQDGRIVAGDHKGRCLCQRSSMIEDSCRTF